MLGDARRMRVHRLTPLGVLAVAAIAACNDSRSPVAVDPGKIGSRYLSGAAAQALNERGQFNLPTPVPEGQYAELTSGQAEVIANAFVGGYASFRLADYEQLHGADFNLASTTRCGRIFYAKSAYGPLPSDVPINYRKALGPQWMVTYCDGGVPVLSVAVAAFDTDVRVDQSGSIWTPPGITAAITSEGIPLRLGGTPISPEAAALFAAQSTGKRVSAVPELVLRTPASAGQSALWQVTLESPARVSGVRSGTTSEIAILAVGFDFGYTPVSLFAPVPFQGVDPVDTLTYSPLGSPGTSSQMTLPLIRRLGIPHRYEAAVPSRTGGAP